MAEQGTSTSGNALSKLLQNVNTAGTASFFKLMMSDQPLAIPHVSVPNISWVDWDGLRAAGFKACIYDKDNTLTEPFELEVNSRLRASFTKCQEVFGGRLALYSNSAGLQQYDPEGEEAAKLEGALGLHVLRHKEKKPAGGCTELEQHFGCSAQEMIFIGDRYLTDVVFGNRHGMLTVRVAPLTTKGEPPGVLVARQVEEFWVKRWLQQGVKPPPHALLQPSQLCQIVKEPAADQR